MSQYFRLTPEGAALLNIYFHELKNSKPYTFDLSSFHNSSEAEEYSNYIKTLEEEGLIETYHRDEVDGIQGNYTFTPLTEKGKRHASELKKIKDQLPKLP
jgi:DNA-binding PadR family transcriptional regulator